MTNTVIIAGAGPVGLMLACELQLQKVSTVVLERRTAPDETIKAGSINLATVEALRRRGFESSLRRLHDETLLSTGHMFSDPPPDLDTLREHTAKFAGHFAGLFTLNPTRIPLDDPDWTASSGKGGWMLSQQQVEQLLRARLSELGGELRTGCELTGFTEEKQEIRVTLSDGSTISGEYLVGCDGGRSRIRKLGGFEFPGTAPTITGHQALVDITDPEKLPKGWTRTPTGMLTYGPIPGRISTVEFDQPPADRDAPITLTELQDCLRRVSGTDVTITKVHTATRYSDNARQASTYRIGRVFLAGDAAHVHSPFSGQGLNLGIGDAVNLGWKLALVVQGKAPETLLDSYTEERHPIGARVVESTRAQVALMRPGSGVTALRDIVTETMKTVDGNAYFTKMVTGIAVRYNLGAGHELLGKQMPALSFTDGTDTADYCQGGKSVVFDFTGSTELPAILAAWSDRVDVVTGREIDRHTTERANGQFSPEVHGAFLVRPDGYIAWAADSDSAGLREALLRWLGEPAAALAA